MAPRSRLQEIVIKEWKEVDMGELFETSGVSTVLHTFAEKECNPLMTLVVAPAHTHDHVADD